MGVPSSAIARAFIVALLTAAVAGCGGKGDESASAGSSAATKQARSKAAKASAPEERMANAVATAKTGAAVDLQYDLLARPAAGQPFEIELAITPRLHADALEIEAHGMPGLDVVTGGSAAFQNVVAGERYTAKLLVKPATKGVYYIAVTAKLTSKVQSDTRAFSVPVVVGDVPAAPPASAAK